MQSTGTTKTEQDEIRWIVPTLNGYQPHGLLHIIVHDIDDALREGLNGFPFPCPRHGVHGRFDAIRRERNGSAKEKPRRQPAKNYVGIRHREPVAPPIADRARVGPRALRTDAEGGT